MPKLKKQNYIQQVARRRSVSARARLVKGAGESSVNSRAIDEYFPGAVFRGIWTKPLQIVGVAEKYHVTAKISGGGKKGQVDALSQAIAKALVKENPEYKKPLKDSRLLTRDARVRQRRMVGTGGKARRKKQSPKR